MNLAPLDQTEAWRQLRKLASALPQGLILIGPSGVGKKRSALALFQWMHCEQKNDDVCGTCAQCRKIAEGRHPDILLITPKGENIAVDDLREMKKALFFSPIDGTCRFVIIDDAHKMNASSANALLKILEEPPSHTRFFLITHERGLLPQTIVSRCQFVLFSPLRPETQRTLLENMNCQISGRHQSLILELLNGGMDGASNLTHDTTGAFFDQLANDVFNPSADRRFQKQVQLAEQLSSASNGENRLELFLDVLVCEAGRRARAERDNAKLWRWCQWGSEAVSLRRKLEHNANRKLIALAASELAFAPPHPT